MSEPQINWINISGSGVFHQVRDELLDTIIENAPIPAKITAPKTRCWFSSDSFLSDATLGRPGWLRQTALRELQVLSGTHREVTPRKWIEHGDMIRGCPFNTVLNKDVIECFVDTITTPDWWNRKNAPRHFGYWTPCVNSPLPYNK